VPFPIIFKIMKSCNLVCMNGDEEGILSFPVGLPMEVTLVLCLASSLEYKRSPPCLMLYIVLIMDIFTILVFGSLDGSGT
jgi:hypothetical protein